MKYSNEIIKATINTKNLSSYHFVIYYLYLNSQLIYTGQVYVPANTSSVEVYLNDILENYYSVDKINSSTQKQGLQISEYTVTAIDDDITTDITDTIYFYNVPANISIPTSLNNNLILDRGDLLPIFPSGNNAFLAFSLKGNNVEITANNEVILNYTTTDSITDSVIFNTSALSGDIYANNNKVASIGCGRYFLYWYTRNGVIQCQPFNGKVVESEDVTSVQTVDFLGYKTNQKHKVKSKWNLNTAFITEANLELYKDIITSKYLYLYDVKTGLLERLRTIKSYLLITYKQKNQNNKDMNIELYINNTLVEVDKTIEWNITKTFSDIENPTAIFADYSKTITVPATNSNNQLFGNLFSIDRITAENENNNTGIFFNPLKKADCQLFLNGDLILDGYAKVTEADKKSYTINIIGALGKIFNELDKYIFTNTDSEYKIDSVNYLPYKNFTLTSAMIKNTFIQYQNPIFNSFVDCFGFYKAFRGHEDDIEETSVLTPQNSGFTLSKFTDILYNKWGNENNNYKAILESRIDKGLYWYEFQNQIKDVSILPYVYCNKLIQCYQRLLETKTDYTLELDKTFFNYSNPFYSYYVYTLPSLKDNLKINPKNQNIIPNIFGEDFKLQKWVLDYTKKFGLVWRIDYTQKKIYIETKNTYFSNCKVEKLDEFITDIKVNTTNTPYSKYIFKFKDVESNNAKEYKKQVGKDYGYLEVNTGNELDTEEKVLFDLENNNIVTKISGRSWNNMYNSENYNFSERSYYLPALFKGDNISEYKPIAPENRYFFRNTNQKISDSFFIVTPVKYEKDEKKYFYISLNDNFAGTYSTVNQIPCLSPISDKSVNNMWATFGVPNYDFTGGELDFTNQNNIYSAFWENWLNFITNKKVVKVKAILKDDNIQKFYSIGNNLFIINKISNYNYLTKQADLELQQINNSLPSFNPTFTGLYVSVDSTVAVDRYNGLTITFEDINTTNYTIETDNYGLNPVFIIYLDGELKTPYFNFEAGAGIHYLTFTVNNYNDWVDAITVTISSNNFSKTIRLTNEEI